MSEQVTIKKGTTIFTSKPFAYVLNSKYANTRCDNCFKSGKLLKCSRCQYVHYCDRNCQRESWSVHKMECANLKRISPKMPDGARLMARVIVKLNKGGADEVNYYTETNFRKFKDLMSQESDIKKDIERMEEFVFLCGILLDFFGETSMPNTAELMRIYGIICINAFNIVDPNLDIIGFGIYLGASVMDHSCKPNAIVVYEGTTIIVRTLVDLPSLDWSQIRISYIDLLNSNKDRQEKLRRSYYFWCNCERCKETESMPEAAACPNSSCASHCSIEADECEECGAKLSKDFKEAFREVTDFSAHHLEKMEITADLDASKICLKKQKGILHKFNVQHIRALQAAFTAAMLLQCWEDAELYAKELTPGYLLYYGEVHHWTGLLYLKTGKAQLYLGKWTQALETLRKAGTVLAITHGEEHSSLGTELRPLFYQAAMKAM